MNKLIIDNNIEHSDIFIDKDTDFEVDLEDVSKDLNIHIIGGIGVKVL